MSGLDHISAAHSRPGDGALAETVEGELSAAQERFWTIYSAIRERIALLDYAPGERLSEGDLADEFGVSRTPLRKVLGRLEVEGLLESRHGVGTFVTSIDMDELGAVYRLRKELAALIGTLDPNPVTPDILAEMEAIRSQCGSISDADEPRKAFSRMNIAFFCVLMKLVGNAPLREMLELQFYRTARMWPALMTEAAIVSEADIFSIEIGETIRYLRCDDVDAAAHLRRCHISTAFKRLESYVAGQAMDSVGAADS
ncbi:MAG: GntR family transcriptional regulator [Rhodomicrobiaceae bacterium]